ncbi:putative metal-dependent hydrolase [Chlorella virus XW01]|nr:putative metal-dependent hydrolase [Chlorella virus XW01]
MRIILIVFIIVFIYIFLFSNHNKFVFIENNLDGTRFLVQNDGNKEKTSKHLGELVRRMYILRNYLSKNKDNYNEFKKYINLLEKGFNSNRTTIYENKRNTDTTSYNVNKGEEMVFCLKDKKNNELHNINLLMYVAIHEMAHIACPEIGHGDLFQKIFKFLTEIAIKLKLYTKYDFSSKPVEYCGMRLTTSIV